MFLNVFKNHIQIYTKISCRYYNLKILKRATNHYQSLVVHFFQIYKHNSKNVMVMNNNSFIMHTQIVICNSMLYNKVFLFFVVRYHYSKSNSKT